MPFRNKRKLNLVGNAFTHLSNGNKGYSVHGKESKYIEWVTEGGDATVYIDNTINEGIDDSRKRPKYLWLIESKHIRPNLVENVVKKKELMEATYDMIFTHDQRLLRLGNKYKWVPANGFWIKKPMIYEKSKMISMISSNKNICPGHAKRLEWVDKLRDRVDLYGRGFNEIKNKEEGLCEYMFSVAIENGEYETYFTEKILDCFATGTIPVYLGAPDIGNHFNIDGILPLNEDLRISRETYVEKIDAVRDNLERVKQIEILEDFIWEKYLKQILD